MAGVDMISNLSNELAQGTIDVINAAIDFLGSSLDPDMDGPDDNESERALQAIRAFTGKTDLTYDQAEALLHEVDERVTEFATDQKRRQRASILNAIITA